MTQARPGDPLTYVGVPDEIPGLHVVTVREMMQRIDQPAKPGQLSYREALELMARVESQHMAAQQVAHGGRMAGRISQYHEQAERIRKRIRQGD